MRRPRGGVPGVASTRASVADQPGGEETIHAAEVGPEARVRAQEALGCAGFGQGGQDGTLTGVISDMAGLVQPHPQQAMINGMASFTSAHAFAVNLVAVIGLAASGAGTRRPHARRAARRAG